MAANRPSIRLTHSTAKVGTSSGTDGLTFLDVPNDMDIPDPTEYWIAGDEPLHDALAMLTPADNSYAAGPIQQGQLNYGNVSYLSTSNPINLVEGMYQHSDNLHNWTTNLAQVLTNQFAILSPAEGMASSDYSGVTNKTQRSHFHIRWCTFATYRSLPYCREANLNCTDWITLPIAVLILAYAFLVATMLETQRKTALPWKSNPLILALAETDESVRNDFFAAGALSAPKACEKIASATKVGLRYRSAQSLTFVREETKSGNAGSYDGEG